jgi:alpha-tubulin suppressor-like RCC1 family protein
VWRLRALFACSVGACWAVVLPSSGCIPSDSSAPDVGAPSDADAATEFGEADDDAGQEVSGDACTGPGCGGPLPAIATGHGHTCAVTVGGDLLCWGGNRGGQLGDGTLGNRGDPTPVGPAANWRAVGAGSGHTCAVRTDGTLWCWGSSDHAVLGGGSSVTRELPAQVGSGTDWIDVAGGHQHACAVQSDRSLWCWGYNGQGQVGDGTTDDRVEPTRVGADGGWESVSGGWTSTCGIRSDHGLWCWGDDVVAGGSRVPAPVGDGAGWSGVSVGQNHACAVRLDGTLWCWGANDWGQLGDGTTAARSAPVQVGTATDWSDIAAAGGLFTCATRVSGTLWCWGANFYGQLANGTRTFVDANPVPAQVGADTNWVEVTGGYGHACGVRSDATVWCWGHDVYGQLGDGVNRYAPTRISPPTSWRIADGGAQHSCGIRSDGTLWIGGSSAQGCTTRAPSAWMGASGAGARPIAARRCTPQPESERSRIG